jgi:chorismate dehydratase
MASTRIYSTYPLAWDHSMTGDGTLAGRATIESFEAGRSTGDVRVGAVAYLNTKPLIYGLENRLPPPASLRLELPSRLATELEASSLDVGLIPAVEYFRHLDRYRRVSNAVIACRGPVWSVRILFRTPPERVRTLAVDEGSRTSVALSKILFQSRFGFIPQTVPFGITEDVQACRADAVLVIGDRAMKPERFQEQFPSDWDLGQEWFDLTGLPFVFAMWVARSERFASATLARVLEECRDEGCARVESIAEQYAARYGLTHEECLDYLAHYLRFRLNVDELAGLNEFHRRCLESGLVPASDSRKHPSLHE